MPELVVYGAYGYTGELISREAVDRRLEVELAGRNPEHLATLAGELGVSWTAVELDDAAALERLLSDATAVLHCAGPFADTWRPMAEACLATGTHYLDITGEAAVFENLAALSERAEAAGVMLLPGVGFDVVPSDCLALHLKERLPAATRLVLAFDADGRPSRGTATTIARHLGEGGLIRDEGELTSVPLAWKTRTIDFGDGPRSAVIIPWGDVSTAWRSTGIPHIEVYTAMPPTQIRRLQRLRRVRPLLALRPVRALLERLARRGPAGPSAAQLETGITRQWGEVSDDSGRSVSARQTGPQAYRWTALTAVAVAERVLGGDLAPGYQTPATAYGSDFVLQIDGVERHDLD